MMPTSSHLKSPPPVDAEARQRALVEKCEALGIPVTAQRRAVLAAVLALDSHPTADEVFDHLVGEGAEVSRATVYRTLDSLVELGLVAKTCHPGRGVRFDRVNTAHHHLVCLQCNAMVDFVDDALDGLRVPDLGSLGFQVTDYRVQVRGLCQACQSSSTNDHPSRS